MVLTILLWAILTIILVPILILEILLWIILILVIIAGFLIFIAVLVTIVWPFDYVLKKIRTWYKRRKIKK